MLINVRSLMKIKNSLNGWRKFAFFYPKWYIAINYPTVNTILCIFELAIIIIWKIITALTKIFKRTVLEYRSQWKTHSTFWLPEPCIRILLYLKQVVWTLLNTTRSVCWFLIIRNILCLSNYFHLNKYVCV